MRLAILLLCAGACSVGTSATSFWPAKGPEGIAADLRVNNQQVRGELLEVQDSALVLLRAERVVVVPLADIVWGSFRQRGTLIQDGRFLGARAAAQLKLVSRFPQGLTEGRRAALLAAYGQTAPDRVTP